MSTNRRILISRTDAIGDVILTLPMATLIKEQFPDAYVGFLGKNYTRAIVACCSAIDEFVEVEDFLKSAESTWDTIIHVFPRADVALRARKLHIKTRIGTTNRVYHWLTCTNLLKLSRRHSDLRWRPNQRVLASSALRCASDCVHHRCEEHHDRVRLGSRGGNHTDGDCY